MKLEKVTVRINLKAGLEVEKTVSRCEANLLGSIHGSENVQEQSSTYEDGTFDAKAEWEALVRKYGSATNEEGKSIVRLVYPDPHALGRYFDRTAPEPPPQKRNRAQESVSA